MATFGLKGDSRERGSFMSMQGGSAYPYDNERSRTRPLRRWLDSFRRDPGRHITPASVIHTAEGRNRASVIRRSDELPHLDHVLTRESYDWHYFDLHAANVGTANTMLSRELKGRHLQMIAIGGSIGMSCFHDSLRVFILCPRWLDSPTTSRTLKTPTNTYGDSRHWIIRSVRKGPPHRRPGFPPYCISLRRRHALLHHPSPG